MNVLRKLSETLSRGSDVDPASRVGSKGAGVTWNTDSAALEAKPSQHKSLKEFAIEAENSLSDSSKSENLIEYTEKEQELHQQVEKLDIVPEETECKCSGVLAQENTEDFDGEPTTEEFDKVYQSGVSAIVNASGKLPQRKEVYEEFLMEACGMGPEKHNALKRRSLHEIAELSLHVGIQRAKDLVAKDNTGTSDPYCRVALVHEGQVNKPHRDLAHWQEKRVVNTVLVTPVVQKNLSPEWNRSFQLVLLDPRAEFLAVEVWDSDETEQSFSKTKGIEGFVNYIRDLSKKDDFLGKLYVPLQEIPIEETTKWYNLVSHKGKPRGMIQLDLQIHSKLPLLDEEEAMAMFTQLYRLFVSHERKKKGEFTLSWDGSLCQTAKEILSLLSTRLGLDRLQQAVCKTHVLFRNKVLYPSAVLAEVKEIRDCRAQLDAEETRTKPWVQSLMSSFSTMVRLVQDFIKDHQFRVNLKTAENVQMVGEMLQLMQVIYSVDAFVIMLDKDFANMKAVIQIALQGSCARWYQKLLSSHFEAAEAQSAQNRILLTLGALRGMMNFLNRSKDALQYHFNRVGVDYFQIVYLDVDKQLAGDLETVVNSELGKRYPTDTFMLFDTVKAFIAMGKQLPDDVQQQLKLTNCFCLFRRHVPLWIDERVTRFEQGMWSAIKAAEATPVVESVKYTTAVRDTIDLMIRVCSFWKTLQWPDPEEAVTFLQIMTENLCTRVLRFVHHMARKLHSSGYYLEERKKGDVTLLVVSEKICVHLNDIQQLQGALLDLPNYLDWAEQKASLSSHPRGEAVRRVFEALQTFLDSCDEDMHHKMVELYEDICHCLEPSLRSAMLHVQDQKKTLEEGLPFLMDYLTEMLTQLYQSLFHSVFKSILFSLWTQLVNILSDIATDDMDKQSSERLLMIIGTLLSYFNSEGEGLTRPELMQNKTYQELHAVLELRLMPTEKVIASYYHELLEYQKTTSANRGSVSIVVGYIEAHNQLDFTLVKGSNLPAMDFSTKSSDPFAVISLVPEHVFKGVKPEKTGTHRTTLSPVFNAHFQFPVEHRHRSVKGAALLIEVYDYDRLASNDVIGVTLIALPDIPAVSSTQDSSLTSSSQHHITTLPLFIPVDSPALRELTKRSAGKKDLAAHEFVKKIRKLRSL